jgi:hypothetical protein
LTPREYANVINVFFVLVAIGIEVEGSSIRDIAAHFVRDDGDVIADLILVRIALERVECITNSHIRRPRHTCIGAKRIK